MGISTDERLLYDKIITLLRELIGGSGIALPAGAATEAKQDDVITELGNILTALGLLSTAANQATTHTKLDAIVAALTGIATEAKQDAIITALGSLATESTLALVLADTTAIKNEQVNYGRFSPNGYLKTTVAAVAITIEGPGAIPADTVGAVIIPEGGDMRYIVGSDPTASEGTPLKEGHTLRLGEVAQADASEVSTIKFIRTGATNGILNIHFFKRT